MAERKAVNKYYPPDWTPSQGSINKYVGQHPLRERARKLKQGILIIRFELPYNIWCGGCGRHCAQGVRYNAEKKKIGNYYSTPIYRFRMKCHLCDNHFEIDTDPKNCDYIVVSGARRKEERWEPSATETVETTDKEDAKRMAIDAMFKLEHGVEDVQKSKKVAPVLAQLQDVQSVWKDDYSANQILRKMFREEKKEIKVQQDADAELKERGSLDIPLAPERQDDIEQARKIRFHSQGYDAHRQKKRTEIKSRPLFGDKNSESSHTLSDLMAKRRKIDSTFLTTSKEGTNSMDKFGILAKPRKPSTESSTTSHENTNGTDALGPNSSSGCGNTENDKRLPTSSGSEDGTQSGFFATAGRTENHISKEQKDSCNIETCTEIPGGTDDHGTELGIKLYDNTRQSNHSVKTVKQQVNHGLLNLSYSDTSSSESSDENIGHVPDHDDDAIVKY